MTSRRVRPSPLKAIAVFGVVCIVLVAVLLLPPPYGLNESHPGAPAVDFFAGGFKDFTGTAYSFPITIPAGSTVLAFVRQADSVLPLTLLVGGTEMDFVAEEADQTGSQFYVLVNAPQAGSIEITQGGSAELDFLALIYTGVEGYVWANHFSASGGPVSVSHRTSGLESWVVGCASNSAGTNHGNATVIGLPEGLTTRVTQNGNGSINGWRIGDTNGIVRNGLNETVTAESNQTTGLAAWWIELMP